MQSTAPIEINGETFPLYQANLAITSIYKNGRLEAYTSLRLVPTKLDEHGNSISSEEHAKNISLATINGLVGPEQEAMQEIYEAVQKYIIAKGL